MENTALGLSARDNAVRAELAIYEAIENDDTNKFAQVLMAGYGINSRTELGDTLLTSAIAQGRRQIVFLLLSRQADVNLADGQGVSPLLRACREEDEVVAAELLNRGAKVNAASKSGDTPLHAACLGDKVELVRPLLEAGAVVNARDRQGRTPLMMASGRRWNRPMHSQNRVEIAKLLLSHGAMVDLKDKEGNTALLHAAGVSDAQIARVLLDNGALVSATNKLGDSAALLAVSPLGAELFDLILSRTGDPAARTVLCEGALLKGIKFFDLRTVAVVTTMPEFQSLRASVLEEAIRMAAKHSHPWLSDVLDKARKQR